MSEPVKDARPPSPDQPPSPPSKSPGPSSPILSPPLSTEPAANPWEDAPGHIPLTGEPHHRLKTPDPSTLDESIRGPPPEPEQGKVLHADEELLHEFDPLANQEEAAAREAWAHSEAHPPKLELTAAPSAPPTDTRNADELQQPPTAAGSAFPSLAALARTFSIPSLPKARPVSLDAARNVPSPETISSFASEDQRRPKSASAVRPPDEGSAGSSGTSSPRPGKNKGKESNADGEPAFDFQKFLDQMKLRGAEPVAKYLRSFLSNFAKRTFTVNDQVKIINDFLGFISARMRETDIWRDASDAEFDNAMEGMEKLVMNRLYDFTFTPQVARSVPPRPITADDLERDRVLTQRIALFGWIEEKHLDIPEGEGNKGFLMFAQQELLKINHYKAPRDKLICILNTCKVIFGLIRHLRTEEGADSFVPILIFVVLKANPDHLLSNVEFINRFRNPEKLQSEAGYYLSSLMGAVSFIETMDHTSLSNISQEEFEQNVESAIQSLPAEETPAHVDPSEAPSTPARAVASQAPPSPFTPASPHAGEESAQPLALPAPTPGPSDNARRLLQKTGDTISKPLSALKNIFNEALDGAEGTLTYLPGPFTPFELGREKQQEQQVGPDGRPIVPQWSHPDQVRRYQAGGPQTPLGVGDSGQQVGPYQPPIQTPYKPRVRRIPSPSPSGSFQQSPENTPTRRPFTNQPLAMGPSQSLAVPPRVQSLAQPHTADPSPHVSRTSTPNLDFAGMQAEIDHAHDKQAEASRETLRQIFPGTDLEVVEWVLEANEGDLGKSIEALLEMSSGT